MAEQLGDHHQVGAAAHQLGGEGVAQHVGRGLVVKRGRIDDGVEHAAGGPGGQPAAAAVEEHRRPVDAGPGSPSTSPLRLVSASQARNPRTREPYVRRDSAASGALASAVTYRACTASSSAGGGVGRASRHRDAGPAVGSAAGVVSGAMTVGSVVGVGLIDAALVGIALVGGVPVGGAATFAAAAPASTRAVTASSSPASSSTRGGRRRPAGPR